MNNPEELAPKYIHTFRMVRPFEVSDGLYNTVVDVLLARGGLAVGLEFRDQDKLGVSILTQRSVNLAEAHYPALRGVSTTGLQSEITSNLPETHQKDMYARVAHIKPYEGAGIWHLGVRIESLPIQQEMTAASRALLGLAGIKPPKQKKEPHISFASSYSHMHIQQAAFSLRNAFPQTVRLQPIEIIDTGSK